MKTAFQTFLQQQQNPRYPQNLLNIMEKTPSSFQAQRACSLLNDWAQRYQLMNDISQSYYRPHLKQILKKLLPLQQKNHSLESVICIFYYFHYVSWRELTQSIKSDLEKSQYRNLRLLWFIAMNFVDKVQSDKQDQFIQKLAIQFQEPLRNYQSKTFQEVQKVLAIMRLFNIRRAIQPFIRNCEEWIEKVEKALGSFEGEKRDILIIEALGSRSLLRKGNPFYYKKLMMEFIGLIQQRILSFSIDNQLDLKLLDTFKVLLTFDETKNMLMENTARYTKSILHGIQYAKQKIPKTPFLIPKYDLIKQTIYNIFWKDDLEIAQQQILSKAHQLIKKANNTWFDEELYYFFNVLTEGKFQLSQSLLAEIVKFVTASHLRRLMPTEYYILAAKIFKSCTTPLKSDQVILIIKAYGNNAVAKTTSLSSISQLRIAISQVLAYFLEVYLGQNDRQKLCALIFDLVETFQREQSKICTANLKILLILMQTQALYKEQKKLQGNIESIRLKLSTQKQNQNIYYFLSLILGMSQKTKLFSPRVYVKMLCIENSNQIESVGYRIQGLIQDLDGPKSEHRNQVYDIFRSIISNPSDMALWSQKQMLNLLIMFIETMLIKCDREEVIVLLKQNDQKIQQLLQKFIIQGQFTLMFTLSEKLFSIFDNYKDLLKMGSYKMVKDRSFDFLSESFNKSSVISATTLYCAILVNCKNRLETFSSLNHEQFLIDLFKGCDQFIGKQKLYPWSITIILLAFYRYRKQHPILNNYTRTIKNVTWWVDAHCKMDLKLPLDQPIEWIVMEPFKAYYLRAIERKGKDLLEMIDQKLGRGQKDQDDRSYSDL